MLSENTRFLRVHRFLPETEVEGPGRRAALWVQGCPIHCPGCANGATWPFDGGYGIGVADLFVQIREQQNIEGVTFIGGEPFSQAGALTVLGRLCQEHGLSVVTFTGYDYARLAAADRTDWSGLLAVTDLLLSGPFREEQRDFSRPWIGSRNQEFVFLTDRYRYLQNQACSNPKQVEVQVDSGGAVRLNGLVPVEDIAALRRGLTALGLQTY